MPLPHPRTEESYQVNFLIFYFPASPSAPPPPPSLIQRRRLHDVHNYILINPIPSQPGKRVHNTVYQ